MLQPFFSPTTTSTPSVASGEASPFPAIPPAPADFASPIPVGPVVAVQSLFGFPNTGTEVNWDPVVGMYCATHSGGNTIGTAGVFEQGAGEAGGNAS